MGRLVVCIFPRVLELLIPIAKTAKPNCHTLRDHIGIQLHPRECHITPHPKLHGRLCQMPNTAHHHKDFTSSHYRFPIQKSRSEPWCSASPSLRCCDSGYPSPRLRASFILLVIFFSLPPLISLVRAVDRGDAERAVKGASGEASHQGSGEGPGVGRPVVGGLPRVLSTKV